MATHLVKWDKTYSRKGLTIIDIHSGDFDEFAELKTYVAKKKLPYAVLHDGKHAVIERYGVAEFPHAVLIGTDGKVLWEGNPTPGDKKAMAAAEKQVVAALAKVDPKTLKRKAGAKVPWMDSGSAFAKAAKEKKLILFYKDWPR